VPATALEQTSSKQLPKIIKNHQKIMDQNLSKINPKSTKNQ
jgi:hypothetical protein